MPLAQRIASARVDVSAEAVRRDLFVAADAARLAQPGATTDLVLERLLAELYARNPGLSADDAIAAIGDLRDAATLPDATELEADGANGRIERVLAALAATHPTGAVAAALGSLAADALAPPGAALPGDRAIALGGELDTLTDPGAAFDPVTVLARSARLAAAAPRSPRRATHSGRRTRGRASPRRPRRCSRARRSTATRTSPPWPRAATSRAPSTPPQARSPAPAPTPSRPRWTRRAPPSSPPSATPPTATAAAPPRERAATARETFAALSARLLADGGQTAYADEARQAIAAQDRAITALGAYATGDRSAVALGGELAGRARPAGTVDARYAAATAPASTDPSLRVLRALSTQSGGSGLAAALAGADAGLPGRVGHLAGLAATLDAVAADPTLAAAQLSGAGDQLAADRLAADVLGPSALTALTGPLATAIDDGLDGDATLADATSTLAAAASDADGWTPAATGVPDVAAPGRWALAARGLAALSVARPGALTADERDRLDAASATGTALQTTLTGIGPLGDELCAYRVLALGAGSAPGCTAPGGSPQTLADALDASEQAARDAIAGVPRGHPDRDNARTGRRLGARPLGRADAGLGLRHGLGRERRHRDALPARGRPVRQLVAHPQPEGRRQRRDHAARERHAGHRPARLRARRPPRAGLARAVLDAREPRGRAAGRLQVVLPRVRGPPPRQGRADPALPGGRAGLPPAGAALLGGRLRQRLPLPALDRRLDGLLDGDLRRRAEAVGRSGRRPGHGRHRADRAERRRADAAEHLPAGLHAVDDGPGAHRDRAGSSRTGSSRCSVRSTRTWSATSRADRCTTPRSGSGRRARGWPRSPGSRSVTCWAATTRSAACSSAPGACTTRARSPPPTRARSRRSTPAEPRRRTCASGSRPPSATAPTRSHPAGRAALPDRARSRPRRSTRSTSPDSPPARRCPSRSRARAPGRRADIRRHDHGRRGDRDRADRARR